MEFDQRDAGLAEAAVVLDILNALPPDDEDDDDDEDLVVFTAREAAGEASNATRVRAVLDALASAGA